MRSLFLALVLAAAACSSNPKSGGDGGGGGASDMAAGPPDLAPRGTAGVACGATACTTMVQFCCSNDRGVTGDCQQSQNPQCGATSFRCDGPEDCPPADHECCIESGLAECRLPGYCAQTATMKQAYLMCHTDADCGNGSNLVCKLAGNGSPYGLCLPP